MREAQPLPLWRDTAEKVTVPWQSWVIYGSIPLVIALLVLFREELLITLISSLTVLCVFMLYKLVLPAIATIATSEEDLYEGLTPDEVERLERSSGVITFTPQELASIDAGSLPKITILLPLFKEGVKKVKEVKSSIRTRNGSWRKVLAWGAIAFLAYLLFGLTIIDYSFSPLEGTLFAAGTLALVRTFASAPRTKITYLDGITEIVVLRDGEKNIIKPLVKSLEQLDYPKALLDIIFLLEEEDKETIEAVMRQRWKSEILGYSRILVVPPSVPQTKPKACNVGLANAWGDLLVIYDAEDKPEVDQLKKAVLAFRKSSEKTVCIQAKLEHRNPDTNILTALQAAGYAVWFDFIMPGHARIGTHVPLGGTSNFFKIDFLRKIGGWDGFNVTEDHDMGVWIARLGYETTVMDSATWEEGNPHLGNFIRQQSRWAKGHFVTYFVHMRNPFRLFKDLGLKKFLAFQILTGLSPAMCAVNPVFWLVFSVYCAMRISGFTEGQVFIENLFQGPFYWLSLLCMTLGTTGFIYLNMAAVMRRKLYTIQLTVILFSIPYGFILGISAWKAIYQMQTKPHFWEKTNHGLVDPTGAHGLEEAVAATA